MNRLLDLLDIQQRTPHISQCSQDYLGCYCVYNLFFFRFNRSEHESLDSKTTSSPVVSMSPIAWLASQSHILIYVQGTIVHLGSLYRVFRTKELISRKRSWGCLTNSDKHVHREVYNNGHI